MSTSEILLELAKLSPTQREIVRSRLDALDETEPLSTDEQRIVQDRFSAYRQAPDDVESWKVAEADIKKSLGL